MKWNGVLSLIKQIKKFAEMILSDLWNGNGVPSSALHVKITAEWAKYSQMHPGKFCRANQVHLYT